MDPMEQTMLRLRDLQPRIPSWAKAERMEICTPQEELWKYGEEPTRGIPAKREKMRKKK